MRQIEILFEDDLCIVVNKPAGLAVQGGSGVGVSLDRLLAEFRQPSPLLVHRLDRDTSGVILAAKDRGAAALFSALFAGRGASGTLVKRYLALCRGRPAATSGCIALDLENRGKKQRSQTFYKVVKGDEAFSLLELELGTGRMHQIRRHLAMAGNPVLGDDKYGDFSLNRRLRGEYGLKKLLLHAARLIIPASSSGLPHDIDVSAPLPGHWACAPIDIP